MRRTATAALAAALLLVGSVAMAPAQEQADAVPSGEFAEGEVQWVAEHYSLSPAGAERRLSIEDAAGELQPVVRARWPETFAGLWLNDSGSETTVTVAFTDDAAARVAELEREFPFPEALVAATRSVPLVVLEAVRDEIVADRVELQAGRAPEGIGAATQATGGNFDLGVDQINNQILIGVERVTEELRAELQARYGTSTALAEGVSEPWCNREDCRFTMRGGLNLRLTPGNPNGCTSGFPVQGASGRRFVMSASHCGSGAPYPPDPGAARYNWDSRYGTVDGEYLVGRLDAERIVRNPTPGAPWTESSFVWLGDEPWRQITNVLPYANLTIGTTVAYSGRTSSTTRRGPITYLDFGPTYVPGSYGFIVANTCGGATGDSGAPLFRNNSAVGILSGSGDAYGCTAFGAAEFAFSTLNVFLIP